MTRGVGEEAATLAARLTEQMLKIDSEASQGQSALGLYKRSI